MYILYILYMRIDFSFNALCILEGISANRDRVGGARYTRRPSEACRWWPGRYFIQALPRDTITPRFPGVKSNAADTRHFAGRSRGTGEGFFSLLIYLLKSFLKALNRYGVFSFFFFTHVYCGGYFSRSFSNYNHTHTSL